MKNILTIGAILTIIIGATLVSANSHDDLYKMDSSVSAQTMNKMGSGSMMKGNMMPKMGSGDMMSMMKNCECCKGIMNGTGSMMGSGSMMKNKGDMTMSGSPIMDSMKQ